MSSADADVNTPKDWVGQVQVADEDPAGRYSLPHELK